MIMLVLQPINFLVGSKMFRVSGFESRVAGGAWSLASRNAWASARASAASLALLCVCVREREKVCERERERESVCV